MLEGECLLAFCQYRVKLPFVLTFGYEDAGEFGLNAKLHGFDNYIQNYMRSH